MSDWFGKAKQLSEPLLALALVVFVPSCKQRTQSAGFSRVSGLNSFPVYDVTVRTSDADSKTFLIESLASTFREKYPFSARNTSAFIYREDQKEDGEQAFIIAGTNSSDRLRKVTGITGVKLDILEKRMYPWRVLISDNQPQISSADVELHFRGFGLEMDSLYQKILDHPLSRAEFNDAWGDFRDLCRTSGEGFLFPGTGLRQLLIDDNNTVANHNVTHQEVAAPLLMIIEQLETKSQPEVEISDTIEYQGRRYQYAGERMGGELILFQRNRKNGEPRLHWRSGWVGLGVQGSPFQDELFADWVLNVTSENGEKLVIDALTPHLIWRYGFYQGGPYRVAPEKIISFFQLVKSQ